MMPTDMSCPSVLPRTAQTGTRMGDPAFGGRSETSGSKEGLCPKD
jgi:hypothetical protein